MLHQQDRLGVFSPRSTNPSYSIILSSLQKGLSLFVKCPLIFHPIPELRDTPNLLSIVIWDWVRHRLTGRIDTVLLDSRVEVFFFLWPNHISTFK